MATMKLQGKKIGILIENDFAEYEEYYALCRKCARAYNEREGTPA